jgi:periplasmic protein TonB
MTIDTAAAPEVFDAREIARATGVSAGDIERLIRTGTIPSVDGRFVRFRYAAAAVRRLRAESNSASGDRPETFALLPAGAPPRTGLAASGAAHLAALALLVVVAAGPDREAITRPVPAEPPRLVFVATPGPGGGGGGGGLRQPAPPPQARLEGRATLRSPVPPPRRIADARRPDPPRRPLTPPVRPRPVERPADPPPRPAAPTPMPQVVAPVATIATDDADRAGVLADSPSEAASHGPGSGGGVGTGSGTGIGEGDGAGIGPGSGGGTGGGPYRPGSGITPPSLLREVKPDYTQEARRRGVEGDVVVEVVVRADGSVGQVRLLQRLGAGLDERAIDAVRQWRFSPAHRHGIPVDVVVEIAIEFKLR